VEVIACELNEMLSKDGLSWNQELAYPKRSVPFGYAQGNSAKRLNLRWGLSAGSFEPFDGTQGWLIERPIAAFGCHKPDKSSKFPEIESWRSGRVAVR
jgi:predicted oxidoreductase